MFLEYLSKKENLKKDSFILLIIKELRKALKIPA